MKTGKSPGLYGNAPEFYVTFWTQLGSLLLDMIQFSFHRGCFFKDPNTALISLVLSRVHDDQTGFIKSQFASDNVCQILHIIEGASCLSTPCAVLSVDAEKAFNHLEWHFLWQVLHHMGFGTHYTSMIKVLYFNPTS